MKYRQASQRLLALWRHNSPKPAYIHVPAENRVITLTGPVTTFDMGEGSVIIPATAVTSIRPGETNKITGTNYLLPATLLDHPTAPMVTPTVTSVVTITSTVAATLAFTPISISPPNDTGNAEYTFGLGGLIFFSLLLLLLGRAIVPGLGELLDDPGIDELEAPQLLGAINTEYEGKMAELTRLLSDAKTNVLADMKTSAGTTDTVGAVESKELDEEFMDDLERLLDKNKIEKAVNGNTDEEVSACPRDRQCCWLYPEPPEEA
jgi:hypothetical protein